MQRFVRAVNANARRFSTPESVLIAELPAGVMCYLLDVCLTGVWRFALINPAGGAPLVAASVRGEIWT